MSEWKEVRIGDVCQVGDGAHASIKRVENGIPYLTSKNFTKEGISLNVVDLISEIDFQKHFKKESKAITKPKGNDVLLSIIGTIGAPYLVKDNDEFGISSSVSILRPNNKIIVSEYILYWIKSEFFQKSLNAIKSGVAQSFLSLDMIRSLPLKYPRQITTQQRIASILSAYDDLIENNLKRIKLLEEIAQRTYEEWFVKFRINGVQLEVGENGLPEGWERKRLNEVVDIVSGYAFKSKEYIEDGSFKIVTIKNVQDGYFIPQTTDTIETMPNNLKESQILKTGDFILSLTGNVGRTCMVYGDNFLLNQRVAKIVVKKTINNAFIYCLLRSRTTITNLENMSNGAAQQNLSPVNMGNMTIVFGNEKILLEYSQKFNASLNLICKLNLQNSLLKESRDILLPRLMSGKLGV
jgi:type I restriction enzyme S subunit